MGAVCRRLGGVTIVRKGAEDIVSDGSFSDAVEGGGSLRRAGGQGDLLAGTLYLLSWI